MPPIQVFSNSPINAAKPSGTTPQTSQQQQGWQDNKPPITKTAASAVSQQPAYQAAQPGAAPSQPTGSASHSNIYTPTPTSALGGDGSGSPPAPQPGAVPAPPGASSTLPPPPKAGEKFQPPPSTTAHMPPQMSYSLPTPNAPPHNLGSSTSTAVPLSSGTGYPGPARPTTLMEGGGLGGSSYGQPGGYQQNTDYQQNQQGSYRDDRDNGYDSQDDSVWGAAKKWAYAAGDSLAKAENEVWKRINKD